MSEISEMRSDLARIIAGFTDEEFDRFLLLAQDVYGRMIAHV